MTHEIIILAALAWAIGVHGISTWFKYGDMINDLEEVEK